MVFQTNKKTGWFHLAIILAVTAASLFIIKEAMDEPFVQWQTHNEVRAAALKDLAE